MKNNPVQNIVNKKNSLSAAITLAAISLSMVGSSASAATIYWTDWGGSNTGSTALPFTGLGTITTPTDTVNVTYNNPQGIAFYQASGGTDYWQNNQTGRNPATSPYTSAAVDNIPTETDIVALQFAGDQTLTFSKTVVNPVLSYVSLNGNGYAFDRDFSILSVGGVSGRDCGYWGCGTSSKSTVFNTTTGKNEYQLIGTGEPHGSLQFTGSFDTVSWRSLSSEDWNGFTVGVQGTAAVATAVPEPFTIIGTLVGGTAAMRMRKKLKSVSKG